MKKYIFTVALIALLSGCDKWNDIVGQIKEKSPWVYSEDTDQLNNSKLFVAKREYINKEGTVQSAMEFQCDAKKILKLKITTFETTVINGKHPGTSLNLGTFDVGWQNAAYQKKVYFKTRNGELKLAFPAVADENFSNAANIALTGVNLNELQTKFGEEDLKGQGYTLAADRKKIPDLFRTKDWIIEVPTEGGISVIEIDLANKDIQKVFLACSWMPEFSNTVAQVAAPVTSQPQSPTKGLVISAYESSDESEEIKDFGKPVVYDYCYDGGGGPDHMIIKGDYQNLKLFVNTGNDINGFDEDKNPLVFNVQGSVKIKIRDEISGPMFGKILIKQSNDVLFQKVFTSHGCQ